MGIVGVRVAFSQKGPSLQSRLKRVPQALAFGLNNGGRLVFTEVRRELWKKTGAKKYATITSRTYNMPAKPGALAFTIVAKGKPIPIREFPVRRVSWGVQAAPWAATRVFEHSFQLKLPGGVYIPNAWRARTGPARDTVRLLWGPNLAKELVGMTRDDQTIPDVFMRSAARQVPPQIVKALGRALGV